MKALIITVGSRGDAEPFCALADALLSSRNGFVNQVDLFLQTDMQYLAPPGTYVHQLPFTMMDFYKHTGSPTRGADHPNPRVKFVGTVADIIAELVLPCTQQVVEVAQQRATDVILTSSLARPLALLLGSKLGIPVAVVHLQPLAPTRQFPHYSGDTKDCVSAISSSSTSPGESNGSDANEESYWMLERFQHEFLEERLAETCKALDVPMITFDGFLRPALRGELANVLIVNSFCGQLVPAPSDSGPHVHHVGPLADDYTPRGWTPPAELLEFLEHCPHPPVCVGYGSMPFDKALVVLEAMEWAGERAVLVGDALKAATVDNKWAETNLCQVSSAPYAWLLPRCSMMFSHGGAGVVNATLRAGIPPVISPLMGDQFFWAALLESRGVGVQAGTNMSSVAADDLVTAIQRAKACQDAAKAMGETIKASAGGTAALIGVLESALSLQHSSSTCCTSKNT